MGATPVLAAAVSDTRGNSGVEVSALRAPPSAAVCIVGQMRTLGQTAESLRKFVLEELLADGFVVLATKAVPTSAERAAVEALGPRIVSSSVGPEQTILNMTLVERIARAKIHAHYVLHQLSPRTNWPRRLAAFLAHLKQCHYDVMQRAAQRGAAYDLYVRIRPDVELFEPLPAAFATGFTAGQAVLSAGQAVLPVGEDYGGLNDRFLVGDAAAFDADASRWRYFVDDRAPPALARPWNCERYFAATLHASGVVVRRAALAYCIVLADGTCKYPGELSHSLDAMPTLLEAHAALCSHHLDGALLPGLQPGLQPERSLEACDTRRPLAAAQSPDQALSDPGFCRLEHRCRAARLQAPAVCLADGSVAKAGERLAATVPCVWGTVAGEEGAPASARMPMGRAPMVDCPAAAMLHAVANGTVGKRELELVIARFEEDISWSVPFTPVRTVYDKSASPLQSAVPLPNIGLEQHTYLTHIVRRYDTLARRTVFLHGRKPSCGFFLASGQRGGHLLANVSAADYLTHPLFDECVCLPSSKHDVSPRPLDLLARALLTSLACARCVVLAGTTSWRPPPACWH